MFGDFLPVKFVAGREGAEGELNCYWDGALFLAPKERYLNSSQGETVRCVVVDTKYANISRFEFYKGDNINVKRYELSIVNNDYDLEECLNVYREKLNG